MKILFLYGNSIAEGVKDWLENQGHNVIGYGDKLDVAFMEENQFDLIVSYTYRYIVEQKIIDLVKGNAINLHISYLPYNKGSNPNQWSFIEDTPKGVTIHYMDATLDTGDIIAQELVEFVEEDTLYTSYQKLNADIMCLFKKVFVYYPMWNEMRKKQVGGGYTSYNKRI